MIIVLFNISEDKNVWLDGYRSDEYVWRWGDDNVSIITHDAIDWLKNVSILMCLSNVNENFNSFGIIILVLSTIQRPPLLTTNNMGHVILI